MQAVTFRVGNPWRRLRPLLLALAFFGATGAELGCSSATVSRMGNVTGKKKPVSIDNGGSAGTTGKPADPGTIQGDGEVDGKYTKSIDNSGASFQVKDVDLLRTSVNSCMGDGMLVVSDEMLLPVLSATPPPALPDAKIRFLIPTQYKAGDDIVDKERGNMVDEGSGPRTNTSADSLTDTYLRSLETVANVVAHNCSLDKADCQCASKEKARAMLTRCLPGLDPDTKEMDESASLLGAICATNGAEGMRKAVASMLATYAFASAR